jgi:hypothetical protein
MSENSLTKKTNRRKFRLTASQIVYVAVSAMIIVYLTIKLIPVPTLILQAQPYTYYETAKAYFFKREEYAVLSNKLETPLIPEGEKITPFTKISNTPYSNPSQKTLAKAYLLEHPEITEKKQLYEEIVSLDDSINASSDIAAINEMFTKKSMLLRAVNYVGLVSREEQVLVTDDDILEVSQNGELCFSSLNFSMSGYVYYSIDGYEDLCDYNLAGFVDIDSLNRIDKLKTEKLVPNEMNFIKSSSNDRLLVALRLPISSVFSFEASVKKIYDSTFEARELKSMTDYYELIFQNTDLFSSFPTVELTLTSDLERFNASVVSVREYNDKKEKVIMLAVKERITNLNERRIETAELLALKFDAYVLPTSVLTKQGDKYFISLMQRSRAIEVREVAVYDFLDDRVILRAKDNTHLSNGQQILLSGVTGSD